MSVQNFLLLFLCFFGGVKGKHVGFKEDFIKWNNFVTSINQKLHLLEDALIEKDHKIKSLEVKIDEQTAVFTRRFENQELKISKQNEELSNLRRKVASLLLQTESDRLSENYRVQTHTNSMSLKHRPWSGSQSSSQSTMKLINSKIKDDLSLPLNTDGSTRIKESQVSVELYNLTYSPRKSADLKSISSSGARQPTEGIFPDTLIHRSISTNQSLNSFSQGDLKDDSKTYRGPLKRFSSERQNNPINDFVHNAGNNKGYGYPPGHPSNAAYFPKPTECNSEVEKTEQRLKQKRVPPNTNNVAFHTVLSATKSTSVGSTIVYDQEMLDIGDGYNPTDGVYRVPESGIYVMTWTTLVYAHDHIQTRLVVNGAIKGISWTDADVVNDAHQTTAVVVLMLNQGDDVFIRVESTSQGSMYSHYGSLYAQPTFSGWKLN